MSNRKREIKFQRSMNIDKRNEDFAYMRKNVFDAETPGLYPSQDFYRENPDSLATDENIMDIIGSEEDGFDIKVISEQGGNINFHNLGSNIVSNTQLTGLDFRCGTFGDDGVKIIANDDHLYRINHATTTTSDEGLLPAGATVKIAGFDGLYYWFLSVNEIYKATTGVATVAFNNIGLTPLFVDFLGDQMVIFCQEAGSIVILFWDKSDTDLFDKRVVIKNAKLIGGGVNDGVLQVVYGEGNSSNVKEHDGKIVVANYNGEKFAEQNSIKAGSRALDYEDQTGFGVGSKVMLFSLQNNDDTHNTELYQNYVYKIHPDGAIEAQFLPDEVTYGAAHIVRVFYNFICIAQRRNGAQSALISINEETNSNYGDYEDYLTTEYITNFYGSIHNDHQLDGLSVSFEKLFEQTDEGASPQTGEELDVYYRVSERDDFTLMANITVEKVKDNVNPNRDQDTEYADDTLGLPEQRYMISSMPFTTEEGDGEPLPHFNEIQYKFVTKRGFTLTGAWQKYSYISRNTFN